VVRDDRRKREAFEAEDERDDRQELDPLHPPLYRFVPGTLHGENFRNPSLMLESEPFRQ
jgi:hypothetical protein